MKLEVGMYVRTKDGKISKIKWITDQKWEGLEKTVEASFMLENNESLEYLRDNFKASDNPIDLIEVGDYVNGYRVSDILIDKNIADNDKLKSGDDNLTLCFKSNHDTYYLYADDIETVVTKEQFESISYKVTNE